MHSNQLLLVAGALGILGLLIISTNTATFQNLAVKLENRSTLSTISIAQSLIEEIKTKSFDENTLIGFQHSVNNLTVASSFGPEGESYPNFDDIDDYHNYSRTISTDDSNAITAVVKVSYVNESQPEYTSTTNTYLKKVTIELTGGNLLQKITLSRIFTCW
ncbi:MAG: hypothetical protein FJ213_10755 [Ignavibacteria bacterium]|nr:hypothetical protein [Ignavibacteria bacterium]